MSGILNQSNSLDAITASAPGRICLFGEHQDYLGLPVIAGAINLRIEVRAARDAEMKTFRLDLKDTGKTLEFDPNMENPYQHDRDYLVAGANILRREGLHWPCGYRVEIKGDIPVNSGASSSSALQVAWTSFLLAAADDPRAEIPEAVARLAHKAEVTEFGSPGGMMDHFSTAMGGIIWLDCKTPASVEYLPKFSGEFVLVNSGIPKDTNALLGKIRERVEGLNVDFNTIESTEEALLPSVTAHFTPEEVRAYEANVWNRALTVEAKNELKNGSDSEKIGRLLTRHHKQLSENLGTSHPAIDDMILTGLERGALGGKINGSGGGGSFFLLTSGNAAAIRQAYVDMGLEAHIIRIGEGLKLTRSVCEKAAVSP